MMFLKEMKLFKLQIFKNAIRSCVHLFYGPITLIYSSHLHHNVFKDFPKKQSCLGSHNPRTQIRSRVNLFQGPVTLKCNSHLQQNVFMMFPKEMKLFKLQIFKDAIRSCVNFFYVFTSHVLAERWQHSLAMNTH